MSKLRKVTSLRKGWKVHEEGRGWLTVETSYTLTYANGWKDTHVRYVEPFVSRYDANDYVPTLTLSEQKSASPGYYKPKECP